MDLLNKRVGVLCWLAAVGAASACVPDVDTDESTVRAPRVLAVQAIPAESAPSLGLPIRYQALVADVSGTRSDVSLSWFQCLAQKPLAELGPVSRDCLNSASGKLTSLGQGPSIEGKLPTNACSLFGPNPPTPAMGEPAGRPVDADESGGYKLPLVIGLNAAAGTEVTLYEQRISCGLANVAPAVSLEFTQRYHANENPAVRELRVSRAGVSQVLADNAPLEVSVGERVEFELAWADCPARDVCGDGVCGPDETAQACTADCTKLIGCTGQERYLDYDRQHGELRVRTEALRVAWYATAGSYDEERTGVSESERASSSKNTWYAPGAAGTATIWVVVRDSRGGVGFRGLSVTVR
jgi:hypothetical protein